MQNMQKDDGPPSHWGQTVCPDDEIRLWSMGALQLWYMRRQGELWIAHKYQHAQGQSAPPAPPRQDEPSWVRWANISEGQEFVFVPALPDRAIVVKVEYPFRLAREAKTKIYIKVPLWARVALREQRGEPLFEAPTAILSDTWFGSFMSGELCYWISSSAKNVVDPATTAAYLAICPIQIFNQCDSDLLVQKFCYPTGALALFHHNGKIWANESHLICRGHKDSSQMEIMKRAPAEAKGAKMIFEPRKPAKGKLSLQIFPA